MIRLSIITVNYNNSEGLLKTMNSVFAQRFSDFEYIIIDGKSTDTSKAVIKEHASKLSYWVSEKDTGIYNAMNKGITNAKGEYILFLNSGDHLADEKVLEKIFSSRLTDDIVYGNINWETNGVITAAKFPGTLTFEYFIYNSLPHQGTFIRRKLFKTVGMYSEDHRIISDWVFFLLAIYKYNCSYKHIDTIVSVCDRHGVSCEPANWKGIDEEKMQVINKHFGAFFRDYTSLLAIRSEFRRVQAMKGYKLFIGMKKAVKKALKK